MKKILAALLLVVMMLGAVSCGSEKVEAPDGFQNASVDGAPFYLYVPNSWVSNASSGISSAYCSTENRVLVSAFGQVDEGDTTLELYTARTLESFLRTLEKFELLTKDLSQTALGSYAAYCFDYKAVSGKKDMKFRTYVSEYADGFVVLTYSAEEAVFGTYEDDFNKIVANFTFKVANENPVTPKDPDDEKTPVDGWQLASDLSYEYKFFVPKTWTVDKTSEFPTATRSDGRDDNSNVTLMSYVLKEPMTAKDYWEKTQKGLVYDHEVVSVDENTKLGGISAYAVEYNMGLGEMTYRVKQVFSATSNMVYVFTYTSNQTYYDAHLSEVNEMLDMFTFN